MVDVLTLNYNDAYTTIEFVKKIESYPIIRYIVVVDNASTDNSYNQLQELSSNKVIVIANSKNSGYGGGNNFGIKYAFEKLKSECLLLSNPDVIIENDTISKLEDFLRKEKDYAIVAPLMLNNKGDFFYNTAIKIPSLFKYICSFDCLYTKVFKPLFYSIDELDMKQVNNVGSVAGSCFLMDTKKMIEKGMFDENMFLYGEELVLGIKMRIAGYKIGLLPSITFIHNHSVSINKEFHSAIKKQKVLIQSKLYIIRNYLNANKVEYAIAVLMSKISLFETVVITKLSK